MTLYEPQTFTIPPLDGISTQTIEEHIGLYKGYVKHFNLIQEILENPDIPEYARKEALRRQGFEFDGIRNHEHYFSLLEGGFSKLSEDSALYKALAEAYGSFEDFLTRFTSLANTRGVGWAMLGYDTKTNRLLMYWVDEQHLGHLTGIAPVITLDMWEHSFMLDYPPSKKAGYIEAFFRNINWSVAEKSFEELLG